MKPREEKNRAGAAGIEPALAVLEAAVLPLNDTPMKGRPASLLPSGPDEFAEQPVPPEGIEPSASAFEARCTSIVLRGHLWQQRLKKSAAFRHQCVCRSARPQVTPKTRDSNPQDLTVAGFQCRPQLHLPQRPRRESNPPRPVDSGIASPDAYEGISEIEATTRNA